MSLESDVPSTSLPIRETVPSAPDAAFQYKPLDTHIASIRLLLLLPPLEEDDGLLRFELQHTTFKDKPEYQALSYRCGTSEEKKPVLLNGHEFKVGINLWHALVGLRTHIAGQKLWVDAVCINQSDLEERSAQVSQMDFIYQRAQCVLIWLGPEVELDLNPVFEAHISHFRQLVSHPYWTRLWIIQEIGLSRKAKIFFSNTHYDWDVFIKGILNYRERCVTQLKVDRSRPYDYSFPQVPKTILNLDTKRKGRHGPENRLEVLLETFDYAECKETQDKIFGLLGLAHDCEEGDLRADYTKSVFEIYVQVVKFFRKKRLFDNRSTNKMDRSMRLIRFSQLVCKMLTRIELHATAFFKEVDAHDSNDVVQVRGSFGGKVVYLGPTYNEIISQPIASRTWKSSFDRVYPLPEHGESLREANEAFISTLVGMNDKEVAKYCPIDPITMYSRCFEGINGWQDKEESWKRQELDNQSGRLLDDNPSITNLQPDTSQCRLFLGDHKLMGLAPSGAKLEDIICHFWKTDVVALIREEAGSYEKDKQVYRIVGRAHLNTGTLNKYYNMVPRYDPWIIPREGSKTMVMQMDFRTLVALTSCRI